MIGMNTVCIKKFSSKIVLDMQYKHIVPYLKYMNKKSEPTIKICYKLEIVN